MIATETISPVDWAARAEAPTAAIYSFVPAGGAKGARSESRRAVKQLSEAIGAYLTDADDDRTILLDFFSTARNHPRPSTIFKDLSDAGPGQAYEAIRVSEAVFVVSTTDPASIEEACAHAALVRHILRSLRRDNACGLLLVPTPGGIPEVEAERRIGLPICGVLRNTDHIAQVARCIAQD